MLFCVAERCEVLYVCCLFGDVVRDFSKAFALVSFGFYGVHGLGMVGWYSLVCFDHFWFFHLGCVLSELVKYSLIERYLAAKFGTILAVLVW